MKYIGAYLICFCCIFIACMTHIIEPMNSEDGYYPVHRNYPVASNVLSSDHDRPKCVSNSRCKLCYKAFQSSLSGEK